MDPTDNGDVHKTTALLNTFEISGLVISRLFVFFLKGFKKPSSIGIKERTKGNREYFRSEN